MAPSRWPRFYMLLVVWQDAARRDRLRVFRKPIETTLGYAAFFPTSTSPATQRTALKKFATVAALDEIAEANDYNLNISRYVDSSEPPPRLDVQAELLKLRELERCRNEGEQRMNRLLEEVGYVV